MRIPAMPIAAIVLLAALAWTSPAVGYRILLDQVHETLTKAAVDCLARSGAAAPSNCLLERDALRALSRNNNSEFEEAVRWPDDPLHQTNPVSGAQALVNVVGGRCADLIERNLGNLQRAGLACRSHYGDLQFLHAMRSSPEETTAETRAKILAWAHFAYRVARGDVAPDAPFCDQFRARSAIDGAMVPPNFPYCAAGASGWTVGEFFTFTCRLTPRDCDTSPSERRTRRTATGAILHLIQDSYSQSHALRTDSPRRTRRQILAAQIECGAPRAFAHYNRETSDDHGEADKWPAVGDSCRGRAERDDPITASAMALHFLRERRTADEFLAYLTTRVF